MRVVVIKVDGARSPGVHAHGTQPHRDDGEYGNGQKACNCERSSLSGLRPMEVIGAAMRKLLHLVFGVLKTGRPFDPNYLILMHSLP